MSMKPSTAPRTVYSRSGNLIVLFEGKRFARKADASAHEPTSEVTVVAMPSDGGRARVKVTASDGHAEVWRSQKV